MRSFNRLALLALPLAATVSAIDHVCFQDCANSSFKGFPCPGLDLACYCRLDNGQFVVRLNECLTSKCDENTASVYREILGNYQCPTTAAAPATPTGNNNNNNDDNNDDNNNDDNDDAEGVNTLTATISDDVTVTATGSVTVTTSLSLIGDDFTSTIVQTFVTQTIVTTESDTTRTLTITETGGVGGIIGGDNSTGIATTTNPVSTAFTTVTDDEGSTVTSAISTFFTTRTVATTTSTAAETSSTGENSASQVKGGMFLGLAAGFVALFAM